MPYEFLYLMEAALEGIFAFGGVGFMVNVVAYVFSALSLYTIARRREIRKPWLAWIPVVNVWILGSISDQYRYVVKGEIKNKRKWLLLLSIACTLLCAAAVFRFVAVAMNMVAAFLRGAGFNELISMLMGNVMSRLSAFGFMLILAIVKLILEVAALYDVYTSCEPANNVLYLILSILPGLSRVTRPLFLFLCRNQDGGMPPRRETTVEY